MADDIPPPPLSLSGRRALARRQFIWLTGGTAIAGVVSACSRNATSTGAFPFPATTSTTSLQAGFVPGTLPIPPLLAPETADGTTVFRLTLKPGESQFIPDATTATFGFNGPYLGPTLRAANGDQVRIELTNDLGEATTVHWHGMHLPAVMDGGPMQTIEDAATWSPSFTIQQPAATLWYHPHLMGQTLRQVGMGLVGLFILDDDDPAQQSLPHDYGVDDLPLILQAQAFDADGQLVLGGDDRDGRGEGDGRGGDDNGDRTTTLVNGAIEPVIDTSASRLRLRLLNASSREIYTIGFAGADRFHQVASDGGLLASPVALTELRLAPAERVEIVVDVVGAGPMVLQSLGGRDGRDGRDGENDAPTGPLLTINPTPGTVPAASLPTSLPTTLAVIERMSPDSAVRTRDFVLAGGDRDPTINGQAMTSMSDLMDMADIVEVDLDTVEIWNLINESNDTHAFHVHDVQFQILRRDGAPPAATEAGWKDTVVVSEDETVSVIMRFTDYADPDHPYMYHCHLLNHEDNGMMGHFVVV